MKTTKHLSGDEWTLYGPHSHHYVGVIPALINSQYPEPVAAQIEINYAHGGGYAPFEGFTFNPVDSTMTYPDDPPYSPIAEVMIREERVIVYPNSWVGIVQKDGTFTMTRMD